MSWRLHDSLWNLLTIPIPVGDCPVVVLMELGIAWNQMVHYRNVKRWNTFRQEVDGIIVRNHNHGRTNSIQRIAVESFGTGNGWNWNTIYVWWRHGMTTRSALPIVRWIHRWLPAVFPHKSPVMRSFELACTSSWTKSLIVIWYPRTLMRRHCSVEQMDEFYRTIYMYTHICI